MFVLPLRLICPLAPSAKPNFPKMRNAPAMCSFCHCSSSFLLSKVGMLWRRTGLLSVEMSVFKADLFEVSSSCGSVETLSLTVASAGVLVDVAEGDMVSAPMMKLREFGTCSGLGLGLRCPEFV